jgi:hypothetical protein
MRLLVRDFFFGLLLGAATWLVLSGAWTWWVVT